MAFSVDAWGQPAVQPMLAPVNVSCITPLGGKPQLTPVQDIEPTVISKWLPVLVQPIFRQ